MKTRSFLPVALAGALGATAAQAGTNAPTVVCPAPVLAECASSNGTWVVLTATIEDIDGDALTAVWWVNGLAVQTNDVAASGPTNTVTLALTNAYGYGTNAVMLIVADNETKPVTCATTVTIQDTTPPVIRRLVARPNILWPPNHKMVLVRFGAVTSDDCGPTRCRIVDIQSNEPVNGKGDGNTAPDYRRVDAMSAYLRAERSGKGNGRVYTVTVQCRDAAGNTATEKTRVFVPHDMGHCPK